MASLSSASSETAFRVRFNSELPPGCRAVFPCDRLGNVNMDRLTEPARRDYLFARIMSRREWMEPEVLSPAVDGKASLAVFGLGRFLARGAL